MIRLEFSSHMEGGIDHWEPSDSRLARCIYRFALLAHNSKEERKGTEADIGMFTDLVLRRLKCFYMTVSIFTMKYEVIISSNCVLDHDKGRGMFEEWGKRWK